MPARAPLSIDAPMSATVVEVRVAAGAAVRRGDLLVVIESMKMEHELRAEADAEVIEVCAARGDVVDAGATLLRLALRDTPHAEGVGARTDTAPREPAPRADLRAELRADLRADLGAVIMRHAHTLDAARPDAVARRHAGGLRTARENVADLCDAGSFVEYGALAIAAQSQRRGYDDLVRNTPADGMVTGIGSVGGVRAVVLAYDATVLAGTQGMRNHQKTDRLLVIAHEQRLPVVLFAEGGGGRPGDVDVPVVAGLHVSTFASFARLSGRVPLIGIVAGRCFAGNAALLGCCDLVIATATSNIGMGGPAMVEGGGLGVVAPEQIGPSHVQAANGVIDVLVADEAAAVAAAQKALACFAGGAEARWAAPDTTRLRNALPEARNRSYDMHALLELVADMDSLLPLRAAFGIGMHTALARIEGRAVGIVANNPQHLGGAIDADAADKAARFFQLCDAHGLPIVALIDTPGFMVGPAIEERAQVRHVSRMFVVAAHVRVPFLAVVVRKAYGLGAMAMAGGGLHAPLATAAWPSGEFGAMGLEGAMRLGYRKELAAAPEGAARDALFERLLAEQVARGGAIPVAETLEIDALIDPAETRAWLSRGLDAARIGPRHDRYVDPW